MWGAVKAVFLVLLGASMVIFSGAHLLMGVPEGMDPSGPGPGNVAKFITGLMALLYGVSIFLKRG